MYECVRRKEKKNERDRKCRKNHYDPQSSMHEMMGNIHAILTTAPQIFRAI